MDAKEPRPRRYWRTRKDPLETASPLLRTWPRLHLMTDAARKYLPELLALPEDDRAELASELISSLDGPPDADWEATWLAEIDRRVAAAQKSGETGEEWSDVRARILRDLRSR